MPDNSILSRLDGLKIKYEEIGQQMTDPEVIADVRKFIALNKEYKELEPIVHTSEKYAPRSITLQVPKRFWQPKRMRNCVKWPVWRYPNWSLP